jgi:hypothetical protein
MTADVTHKYDDPSLNSMDFLLCIMHDPAVPLHLRMDAASKLLPIYSAPPQVIHITITGGLPPEAVIETKVSDAFEWDSSNRSVH